MAHAIPKIIYGATTVSFDYPPTEPDPEETKVTRKVLESISGIRQVQVSNVDATRKLKFRFLSEALKTSLETFIQSHGVYGKPFKYYDDKNGVAYKTYTLDSDKFAPKMITAVGENAYIYEVELTFRRALDAAVPEGYMEFILANNQVAAANITGLVLDRTKYRTVRIDYEVFRKTTLAERVSNGWFKAFYHEDTGNWTYIPGALEDDGIENGVTFSVTVAGQVQYVTDNMAGSGYQGKALFRNITVID